MAKSLRAALGGSRRLQAALGGAVQEIGQGDLSPSGFFFASMHMIVSEEKVTLISTDHPHLDMAATACSPLGHDRKWKGFLPPPSDSGRCLTPTMVTLEDSFGTNCVFQHFGAC